MRRTAGGMRRTIIFSAAVFALSMLTFRCSGWAAQRATEARLLLDMRSRYHSRPASIAPPRGLFSSLLFRATLRATTNMREHAERSFRLLCRAGIGDEELLEKISAGAKLTISDLKEELRTRGLKVTGRKDELVDRLKEHCLGSLEMQSSSAIEGRPDDDDTQRYSPRDYPDSIHPSESGEFLSQSIVDMPAESYSLAEDVDFVTPFPERAEVPLHMWDDSEDEDEDRDTESSSLSGIKKEFKKRVSEALGLEFEVEEGGVISRTHDDTPPLVKLHPNVSKEEVDVMGEDALERLEALMNLVNSRYKDNTATVTEQYMKPIDEPFFGKEPITHSTQMWEAYERRFGNLTEEDVYATTDWKRNPSGIPIDYGMTFAEVDEIQYGKEEAHLTPHQRELRRKRREEIRKLEDWYEEQMLPPHMRLELDAEREERKRLSAKKKFDRRKGDWYFGNVSIPNLSGIKPTRVNRLIQNSIFEDVPAIFMIYNSTKLPVYLGMSTNFKTSLEVFKTRRPSQCQWIRYYIVPQYEDSQLTIGTLVPIREAWLEDLGYEPVGNSIEDERLKWENDPPSSEPDIEELKPSLGG